MAKTSKIEKNKQRAALVKRYAERRTALKEAIRAAATMDERMRAQTALGKLPRDSNPNRVTNRCTLTGRPRGYLRRFGLSRIAFREKALAGEIPGVIKSSW
ncbi:SSU ribosomal protein S14p (S29e) [Cystobacter fuscus DSM 2262]|uniref:Small ribosomal subunit protein uS14 n=1 Tax=Cystobacter fuscus (strain ATCC 25194 / DSM 2262 / NBRC 100088 / M29) TaxID=1242864 RepID=S9NVW2_CYSF2|nr:30S ribosomal protein S14 [Cystobacter fuscus]EPX55051.1 SSU ribosomal protein S14p (S29e) [Cystobacter fuscus DSM 2262]